MEVVKTNKWKIRRKDLLKSKAAMTGIETAIILIAFVIVAASFAFVVLNMGFFTAQRSKTVIGSGLAEASSAIEIDGSVIAYGIPGPYTSIQQLPSEMSPHGDEINTLENNEEYKYGFAYKIVIYVKLSSGRQPVEYTRGKMVITFTNPRVSIDNIYPETTSSTQDVLEDICKIETVVGDSDYLLEEGEKVRIVIDLWKLYYYLSINPPTDFNLKTTLGLTYMSDPGDIFVGTHETFTIEIKPPVGAILTVERMIPPAVDYVMNLS